MCSWAEGSLRGPSIHDPELRLPDFPGHFATPPDTKSIYGFVRERAGTQNESHQLSVACLCLGDGRPLYRPEREPVIAQAFGGASPPLRSVANGGVPVQQHPRIGPKTASQLLAKLCSATGGVSHCTDTEIQAIDMISEFPYSPS